MKYNVEKIRDDFKILDKKINDHELIYFDSAATSLTPETVIDAIVNYYQNYNANYSRGVSSISNDLTLKIEAIRTKIADFFHVNDSKNIVFTKNTTEGINIISNGVKNYLQPGDEIIISEQEHHANILPWINLAQEHNLVLKYIPIAKDGTLLVNELDKLLTTKTKIVSINHVSSTLGYVNDIASLTKQIKNKTNAFVIIDGAQSAGHINVDLSFGPDAFVCSAHKMMGPTGIGMLYISDKFAKHVEPLNFGGQMVDVASKETFSYKQLPFKYEAGTLNLAGIFGFGAAIDYINTLTIQGIENHVLALTNYFAQQIKDVENITIYNDLSKSHGIISLNLACVHSHESSSDLDKVGIQTRAGNHCSQIYFTTQDVDNNVRISLYAYNTKHEIDVLVKELKQIARKWANASDEYSYEEFLQEINKLKQIRK